VRPFNRAADIGQEHESALEDADEQQVVLIGIVLLNLGCHCPDPVLQYGFVDQHIVNIGPNVAHG